MNKRQLQEVLVRLREQEKQAMLQLAHVQGRIIMVEEIIATDDSREPAGLPDSDN